MNHELNEDTDLEQWTVEDEHQGERLDKHVTAMLANEATRSEIQQWIKAGRVQVNGQQLKANYKVVAGDQVQVEIPAPESLEIVPKKMDLEIVYEDPDVIVINKPRGMVVHPAPGHASGTLVNGLLYHCKSLSTLNGPLRPGIVHRIDKDTSGLLVAAKTDHAHLSLAQQLKEHTVLRQYLAVVHGKVEHQQGTIDAPIGRDPKDRKLYTVIEQNGKHAVTHFVVLEHFDSHTLLELELETGRTHQIRVHMKFIGHPIVGDPAYGVGKHRSKWIQGQALHATALAFTHPKSGKRLEFNAPLPEDMQQLLHILRNTH